MIARVVNIASRCAGFIHRGFGGILAQGMDDEDLWTAVSGARHELGKLYERGDVDKVVAATVAEAETEDAQDEGGAEVSIDEFGKIDLRIAKVLDANLVDGADKLLQLRLDLGGNSRTVFAGVREAYDPGTLVGRLVVVVANLAPRKMRFGTSEGMVLAAGPGGEDIFLGSPDTGAEPGMRVT